MAAHDEDCQCQLPISIGDDSLEDFYQNITTPHSSTPQPTGSPSPLDGFLQLSQLCQIAGEIHRLHSPAKLLGLKDPRKAREFLRSVESLQHSLDDWLASIPGGINLAEDAAKRGPNLTMHVVMFIVHAGSLLNLYR